jgi:hypothetical protein
MNKVASSALIVGKQIHGLARPVFCENTTAGVGDHIAHAPPHDRISSCRNRVARRLAWQDWRGG